MQRGLYAVSQCYFTYMDVDVSVGVGIAVMVKKNVSLKISEQPSNICHLNFISLLISTILTSRTIA